MTETPTRTDKPDQALTEALESALSQVATMKVAAITYSKRDGEGTLAHVAVEGGTHEILCELGTDGELLWSRSAGSTWRTSSDGGDITRALDLRTHMAESEPGAHLYCCGFRGLMEGLRGASRHRPPGTVQFEDFGTSTSLRQHARFRVRACCFNSLLWRAALCRLVMPRGRTLL